jgi:hypothetical protein
MRAAGAQGDAVRVRAPAGPGATRPTHPLPAAMRAALERRMHPVVRPSGPGCCWAAGAVLLRALVRGRRARAGTARRYGAATPRAARALWSSTGGCGCASLCVCMLPELAHAVEVKVFNAITRCISNTAGLCHALPLLTHLAGTTATHVAWWTPRAAAVPAPRPATQATTWSTRVSSTTMSFHLLPCHALAPMSCHHSVTAAGSDCVGTVSAAALAT